MRIKLNEIIIIGPHAYRPVMEMKHGFEVYALYKLDHRDKLTGAPVRQSWSFDGLCRACYDLIYKQTGLSQKYEDEFNQKSIDYSKIKGWM